VPAAFLAIAALGASAAPALAADTTPPTVTATVTPSLPSGQHGYFNKQDLDAAGGKITVNLSASDPSGVTDIHCQENGRGHSPIVVDNQSGTNPRTGSFKTNAETLRYSCYGTDGASPPNVGSGKFASDGGVDGAVFIDARAPSAAASQLAVFQRQHSVRVSWSGRDPGHIPEGGGSGIDNFDVQTREADAGTRVFGAFTEFDSPYVDDAYDAFGPPRFTSRTLSGDDGDTMCFSTQSRDGARNFSGYSAEQCTAIPLDDRVLARTGRWTRVRHEGYYSGSVLRSRTIGSTLTSPIISGTQFALLVSTGPDGGTIQTRWHGNNKTIKLRTESFNDRKVVVLHGYTGRGRLVVRVSGHGLTGIDGLGVWKRP
jgi:hypothetical protein